ncbi:MAG: aminotransferase class I/II-fold pyridoxal phosphate-dependent enzyme [Puniceicoccales bacterium]|nr:aminotransferase class I/II-fold pyridoxal phosphate-dependent enzyme [Puniceicoccales bacterium]
MILRYFLPRQIDGCRGCDYREYFLCKFSKKLVVNGIFSSRKFHEMMGPDVCIAERLGGKDFSASPTYKFAKIQQMKADFCANIPHKDLLDFAIGRPQEMPSLCAIEAMKMATSVAANHHYAECGCGAFIDAAVRYMKRVFAVDVSPERELLPSMGSKNALIYMALALLNGGDVLLTTTPSYPVLATHAHYLGAQIYAMPLEGKRQFLPDLGAIPREQLERAKILHLNYPNNPTGACAPLEFFEEAIHFARKYNLILLHDAAYGGLYNENYPSRSVLQIPGAKDVSVELHSCSKAHNMTGWRIGWVCGNEKVVAAYEEVKRNSDSGQFLPIQMGAIAALDDDDFCQTRMAIYEERASIIGKVFEEKGFTIPQNTHPFFRYMDMPKEVNGRPMATAEAFCQWLLQECGILLTSWDEVGHNVRASMTFPTETQLVATQLRNRLASVHMRF